MTRAQMVVTAVVVIFAAYFGGIPALWRLMPPTATAVIPERWPHDQDMPVQIRVAAMHSNYVVTQVRFYVDAATVELEGATEPFYPEVLLQAPRPRQWRRLTLNRLTFPRVQWMELQAPLARLAEEKRSGRGRLTGVLDVEFSYVGGLNEHSAVMGRDRSQTRIDRIPFVIELE